MENLTNPINFFNSYLIFIVDITKLNTIIMFVIVYNIFVTF